VTISLSKELERFVRDVVRAGLYAREDDVVRDALIRLKQAMPENVPMTGKKAKRTASDRRRSEKPLTPEELDQYMLRVGLLAQLPDTDADFDDPEDEPIGIKGEPLSETVIRERR
jgi:Arc/MetJ-type ribon-helix-helix transcriptional regulator